MGEKRELEKRNPCDWGLRQLLSVLWCLRGARREPAAHGDGLRRPGKRLGFPLPCEPVAGWDPVLTETALNSVSSP